MPARIATAGGLEGRASCRIKARVAATKRPVPR
jgi:hypothetical protein